MEMVDDKVCQTKLVGQGAVDLFLPSFRVVQFSLLKVE